MGLKIITVEISSIEDEKVPDLLKALRNGDQCDGAFDAASYHSHLYVVRCSHFRGGGHFQPDGLHVVYGYFIAERVRLRAGPDQFGIHQV